MGTHSPNVIANALLSCAMHNPHGEVAIHKDRRITWRELTSRSLRIAQALKGLGVNPGDKVAFMFHNSPEFIETNTGIQAAGAIPTPMNYRFIAREVEYQVQHSDAAVLIYDALWSEAVEPAVAKLPNLKHVVCRGPCNLAAAIDYEEFVASGADTDPRRATNADDVAVMIYTGGTTGYPKGVMLTYGAHFQMFADFYAAAITRGLTMDLPRDKQQRMIEILPVPGKALLRLILGRKTAKAIMKHRLTFELARKLVSRQLTSPDPARIGHRHAMKAMYASMPFFHDAAYANLMSGLLTGSACYVLPEGVSLDPEAVLRLVERERVQVLANVPTGWKKLVSFPEAGRFDTSSVSLAGTGGGTCSQALKRRIFELFPDAIVLDAFGQTEMTPITSFRIDADPDGVVDRSVGRAIVEVKIVDEEGREVPRGEIGEILYRSTTVMKGYYKDDQKTAEVMDGGWFCSGDLGYLDQNGEIHAVDRKKECINTGGEKVFPLEVEEVIQTHPKVEAVCVIGVPDSHWGHSVRAVVQVKPGKQLDPEEIRNHCRDKLAGYKIPHSVVFADALPFSPVGKILRQKVRDRHGLPDPDSGGDGLSSG